MQRVADTFPIMFFPSNNLNFWSYCSVYGYSSPSPSGLLIWYDYNSVSYHFCLISFHEARLLVMYSHLLLVMLRRLQRFWIIWQIHSIQVRDSTWVVNAYFDYLGKSKEGLCISLPHFAGSAVAPTPSSQVRGSASNGSSNPAGSAPAPASTTSSSTPTTPAPSSGGGLQLQGGGSTAGGSGLFSLPGKKLKLL